MSSTFASMKKNRGSTLSKLREQVQKLEQPQDGGIDNRFWRPEVDKAGNGSAVIRFLPSPKGEDSAFVRIWEHAFQGPGGWYIERSLSTLGQPDPVGEYNAELWAKGSDALKDQVRKQKRTLRYIANIQVLKHSARPSDEGQVFLYKFGKKIFDKLKDKMQPEFEGEEAMDPFNFWEGANFKLRIRKVDQYPNYDKSEFDAPSPLSDDDAELEKIWSQQHSLQELLAPKNFKSYDELKVRLHRVLKIGAQAVATAEETEGVGAVASTSSPPWEEPAEGTEDASNALAFFKNLANKD